MRSMQAVPAAFADHAVAYQDVARGGQHQPHGEFGDGGGIGVAGMGDDDAAAGRLGGVHALEAGAVAGDQAELGQRLHHRRIGPEAAEGDEGAGAACRFGDGFRCWLRQRPVQVVMRCEALAQVGCDRHGHQNRRLRHVALSAPRAYRNAA